MWSDLIKKAKDGGLDVIQTYVFWDGHEPSPGKVMHYCLSYILFLLASRSLMMFLVQYNFEGRFDLIKFVKLVQQAGLYVHLRIGPYACAEWNLG